MKKTSFWHFLILLMTSSVLFSCGGGGGGASPPAPQAISVTLNPGKGFVPAGTNKTFAATITGTSDQRVTWSIQEGSAGGTISSGGLYTSPISPGTFHLIATSVADSTKSATVTITVPQYPRFAYLANKKDGTVSIYSVDASTGQLRTDGYTYAGDFVNPESLAIDPSEKYLYLADNVNNKILAFSINSSAVINTTGTLSPVTGSAVSSGTNPTAIAVDPTGKYVYVANSGSNDVSAYSINSGTGALSSIGGPVSAGTNPAAIAVDPSGKYVYVANSGSNNVSAYSITNTGALSPVGSAVSAGTAPSSIAVDPSGKYVYVANSGSNNVSAYSITNTGALSPVGSAVPAGTTPSSITVDPSGNYVYVANQGSNDVSGYSINSTTGALTSVGNTVLAGTNPQSVTVDSSGQFVYAANSVSNDISEFSINSSSGVLTPLRTIRGRQGSYSIALSKGMTKISYLPKFAYVANNGDGTVSSFAITNSGALSTTGTINVGSSPNSVTIDPTGQFGYVTLYLASSNVYAYLVDSITGLLTGGNSGFPYIYTPGANPYSLAVDPSGRFAYVSTTTSASFTAYNIDLITNPGDLTNPSTVGTGGGLPNSTLVDPTGQFIFVANASNNFVAVYSFDPNNGLAATVTLSTVTCPTCTTVYPLFVTVDPSGQFLLAANSDGNSNTVSVFRIDKSGNLPSVLSPVPGSPFNAGGTPISIAIDPSGKYVYVVNNTSSSISAFSLDPMTGFLTELTTLGSPYSTGTGKNPLSISIDPSGMYAYVALNIPSTSNNVLGYTLNPSNGAMTPMSASPFSAGLNPFYVTTTGIIQ